eukprot:jgi/Bigna1/87661/estExt_fgenesh1_pg.C_220205
MASLVCIDHRIRSAIFTALLGSFCPPTLADRESWWTTGWLPTSLFPSKPYVSSADAVQTIERSSNTPEQIKAMRTFLKAKGLSPCTTLVRGRCNTLHGEESMRMAYMIMNCQRRQAGQTEYHCSKTDPLTGCLEAIKQDFGALEVYRMHEVNIPYYCEYAEPGFLQEQLQYSLSQLGEASLLSVDLQREGHKNMLDLLRHQEVAHFPTSISTVSFASNTHPQTLTDAHHNVEWNSIDAGKAGKNGGRDGRTGKVSRYLPCETPPEKRYKDREFSSMDSCIFESSSEEMQKRLMVGQQSQELALETMGKNVKRVTDTVSGISERSERSLHNQNLLMKGQEDHRLLLTNIDEKARAANSALDTAIGYSEKVLAIVKGIYDIVTGQTLTLKNMNQTLLGVQIGIFLLLTGAVLFCATSIKQTRSARVPLAVVLLLYWYVGAGLDYVPESTSRALLLFFSFGLIIRAAFLYEDLDEKLRNYIMKQISRGNDNAASQEHLRQCHDNSSQTFTQVREEEVTTGVVNDDYLQLAMLRTHSSSDSTHHLSQAAPSDICNCEGQGIRWRDNFPVAGHDRALLVDMRLRFSSRGHESGEDAGGADLSGIDTDKAASLSSSRGNEEEEINRKEVVPCGTGPEVLDSRRQVLLRDVSNEVKSLLRRSISRNAMPVMKRRRSVASPPTYDVSSELLSSDYHGISQQQAPPASIQACRRSNGITRSSSSQDEGTQHYCMRKRARTRK